MEDLGIQFVVIDTGPQSMRYAHNHQLEDVAKSRSWTMLGRWERHGYPGETLLYRVESNMGRDVQHAQLVQQLGISLPF